MRQFWKDAIKDLPFDMVTVKMLKELDYGDEQAFGTNHKWSLCKGSEDDFFDIKLTVCNTELYAVTWDWEAGTDASVEFEELFLHDLTPTEEEELMQ